MRNVAAAGRKWLASAGSTHFVLARIRAIGKGTGFLFDQSANESQSTVRKPDSPLLSQKERLFDHFNLVATNFNSSRLINNWRGKIFPSKPIQSKFTKLGKFLFLITR